MSMTTQDDAAPMTTDQNDSAIDDRILAFIRELAGGPDGADRTRLEPDALLLDDGLIDSFNIVQIAGFLEESFGIQVPSEELRRENFRSVRAISQMVASALPARHS